jgi:low affinity Fe/Cu permease
MKTWRESRVLLIVAGLAVLAVVPAVLRVMGVTNAWALSSATVVAAVVAAAVVVWQERYKWVAQRRDDLGRLEEAEAEHRAVLEIRRRVLGEEHPDTLTSRNNLASVLNGLGRQEEAEAEHQTVLEIHRPGVG